MTLRIATPDDLKQARLRLDLTQLQLADLLGIRENTVSRLERGTPNTVQLENGIPTFDARWQSHLTLLFAHLQDVHEIGKYREHVGAQKPER